MPLRRIFEAHSNHDVAGVRIGLRVALVPQDKAVISVEQRKPLGDHFKRIEQPPVRGLRLAPGTFRLET